MAAATAANGGPVVWKHIGLHGHSVGTFACERDRILWKSAIASNGDDDAGTGGTSRAVPAPLVAYARWTVFGRNGHLRLGTKPEAQQPHGSRAPLKHELRFDGFPEHDFDRLKAALADLYKIELKALHISSAGAQYGLTEIKGRNLVFRHCVLDEMDEEGQEFEPRAEEEMLSLDLQEVSQCVLPGNNRNELEIQFPESDTVEAGTDQLVSIRLYIPPDPDADPADKEADTAAEDLQKRIMQTANIRKTTGDVIVSFDQSKGTFLTPRGRYGIELYDIFLRLRGQKYDYKIKYDDISRLFLLPKPDEVHMAFVIALDKAIRQGQQRYQYLVLQAPKDPDEVTVHLDEAALEKEYNGELQPVMRGSLANLIAKTFKVIANKKVFIPGKFANANRQACVKCAYRANEGLLYPLEKQFIFIHKPPILIRHNEVDSVEFQRYAGGQGSTRNFDLCININPGVTGGSAKEYTFSGIDRSDYRGLYEFITSKNIRIKNLQGDAVFGDAESSRKPVYNEDEIYGGPADQDDDDGSEDEDFDENAEDEESGSDDSEDDDDLGSEVDDDLDSDLEEARKRKSRGDDDSDGERRPKKKAVKKKKAGDEKKAKKKMDPNAPKKATTSFIAFSNEMRPKIKAENPGASFGELGKKIGEMFRNLSPEEKEKYEKIAAKDKARYKEQMDAYREKSKGGGDDDESDGDGSAGGGSDSEELNDMVDEDDDSDDDE